MVREKVQDKYKAILEAAITVFAERGFWDTPTSLISKTAGVADGTLFNYFKTKDDLINEVYLELKKDITRQMLEGLSAYQSDEDKMRHMWNRYIEWGVNQPNRLKALQQIGNSYELSDEVQAQAEATFADVQQVAMDMITKGIIQNYSVEYLGALLDACAMVTIKFINMEPDKLAYYQQAGFDILWKGVTP